MSKESRETLELFLVMIIVILLITTIFFMSKTIELMYYNEDAKVNTILDKKWYIYNSDSYYEVFEISSDRSINYKYKDNLNNEGRFDNCSLLLYAFDENEFKLKCAEETIKIKIESITQDQLILLVDGNKVKYESSL